MSTEPQHALLSPSKASQWINCPPSIRLSEHLPDRSSKYAEEGTLAHAIGELYLRKRYTTSIGPKKFKAELKKLTDHPLYAPEMDRHCETYVDLIDQITNAYSSRPYVALEVQVDLTGWVPESFGRCDCLVIGDGTLHVIDFKYGQGVPVPVKSNPQLMLYALGAMRRYEQLYQVDQISMTICQPRRDYIDTWSISATELLLWAAQLVPIAQMAWEGRGELACGDWCKFCKASGQCPAQKREITAAQDFASKPLELLTPGEIGEAITLGRRVVACVKAIEKHALGICLEGGHIPGYKAVEGRSNRAFVDTDKAFAAAIGAGIDEALLYERKPITLTAVEKILGKPAFETVLGPYTTKPPGAPALEPETDKRPAITRPTAQQDFKEDIE